MEDLRQLVEICERPIGQVSDETIDSLKPMHLQQLCEVHGLSTYGDAQGLRERLKNFRDKYGEFAPIKIETNGKPPAFPRTQRPPTNLWAATQQPTTNVALGLSTYTAATAASTSVASHEQNGKSHNRAIHRIHLSSIQHNYSVVQSTAAQQQCQVIVVVKADGYGHGAVLTTCHLVEFCGAEAFAVATLEEGVALRKALEEHFSSVMESVERVRPRVRILVLGAPVGYPACFDSYLHYDIELMVSGPEVAASLAQWMKDHDGRKRAEVLRVAESRKEELIGNEALAVNPLMNMVVRQGNNGRDECDDETGEVFEATKPTQQENIDINISEHSVLQTKMNAATLTNVTGHDLAREVRQILIGQKHASISTVVEEGNTRRSSQLSSTPSRTPVDNAPRTNPPKPESNSKNPTLFCGIEDAAKYSRQNEMRVRRLSELGSDTPGKSRRNSGLESDGPLIRKKLRWHALVDSGMGRLGFTTREVGGASRSGSPVESDLKSDCIGPTDDRSEVSSLSSALSRDTVDIIQELYEAEVHEGAAIEFYGMCTHMADANDKSTYTHDQMDRFRALLYRVRAAGIAIPTISTDNSAALLTPSLTHFNPDLILSHDTRGFVRTGGAIYGQRPAFKQLKAVSTLVATVSNVAIIHKGESVGYDRAYVATENVRIATLTIGFADGYPRELGNGVGRVSIREHTFPVAGNVCMDMLMVELGPEDAKGIGSLVTVGDTAVLWGPEKVQDGEVVGEGLVPLAELAATLKTTQSALTCGLDKIRVQRQLVD